MSTRLAAPTDLALLLVLLLATPAFAEDCADYRDTIHWKTSLYAPSRMEDMALSGDLVYGVGTWLEIDNVSDPLAPFRVGRIELPDLAYALALSGSYAYVACESAGLLVVDVSDPAAPAVVATVDTPGLAYGLAVSGSYAYVADFQSGLQIFDITVPTEPTLVGNVPTANADRDVVVSGTHAYVADGAGLEVLDISNPTSPVSLATIDTPGSMADKLELSGSYIYLLDLDSGLFAIDVADPANPVVVGIMESPAASAITVSGSRAYLSCGSRGLQIVDLSNPSAPTVFAETGSAIACASALPLAGYCLLGGIYGLEVVDMGSGSPPPVIASLEGFSARTIDLQGDLAYLAGGSFSIVDLSDSENPVRLSTTSMPDYHYSAEDVAVSGAYAYVAAWKKLGAYYGMLFVYDVTNPVSPTAVGMCDFGLEKVEAVEDLGGVVYVSSDFNGIYVVDAADPFVPVVHSILDGLDRILVEGQTGYATGDSLRILDLADPLEPIVRGACLAPIWGGEISVSGERAVVATAQGLYTTILTVFDISEETSPQMVSQTSLPWGTVDSRLFVDGDLCYLASKSLGVAIFDLSEPGPPTLLGAVGLYEAADVTGRAATLLAAAGNGIRIIPLQCPAAADTPEGFGALSPQIFQAPSPNPASGPVTLRFDLERSGAVRFDVFDLLGRACRSIDGGFLPAGRNTVVWDGSDRMGRRLPAGIYQVRLQSGGSSSARQVVLLH